MMKRISLLTMSVALLLTVAACDLISIDEVEPEQSVSPEQALESVEGFESLLISTYDRLQQVTRYGQQFMLYPDALADGINATQQNSNRYPNPVSNTQGAHLNTWGNPYAAINETNLILAQIDDIEITAVNPEAVRNRIEGEARFLRALNYFDLARTKGYEPGREVGGFNLAAPLRLTPTRSSEDAVVLPRATNQEVYNQVVADLDESIALLSSAEEGGQVNNKNFATPAAAHALRARVALYLEDWGTAASEAQNALDASGLSLVPADGFVGAWTGTTHPESILEMPMTAGTDGDATSANGALDALTIGDEGQQFSFEVIPTQDVRSLHEPSDVRLELFVDGFKDGEGPVVYLNKFPGAIAQNVDPIPLIRVAEMHLIRAEALYEEGDEAGARSELNALRSARNASDITASGSDLLDAIMDERRIELLFEGHRFFDLKRRGMDIPKPQEQRALNDLPADNFRILAPIPNSQFIEFGLEQNPGY